MKRSIPVLVVLCMMFAASTAHAQKRYTVLKSRVKQSEVRSISASVKRMLSGKADADDDILEKYCRDYICYGLTDLQKGGEFGARRVDLKKILGNARSEAVRKKAVDLLAANAMKIAKSSKIHPMARFNAMLIASDLNTVESVDGKPAVPRKDVFDKLVLYLSPKAPDELRMACLIGLMRHAELGTHPDSPKPLGTADRTKLAGAALKILQQTTPTRKNTEDVNDWMRRRAADVLGRAGTAGPNGVVAKVLYTTMLSGTETTGLRCACAEALGRMDLSKSGITGKKLGAALGQLAADCSDEEVALIVAKLSENGGRGGSEYGGGGGYGRGRGSESDDEDEFQDPTTLPTRRRLYSKLKQILFALGEDAPAGNGILSIEDGPAAAESIVEDVKTLVEHLEDDTDLRGLGVAIREESGALADSVSGDVDTPPAPAAPAAEPAAAG